ncbi:MAG: methyltransferase domain-containing protein [Armatimonadetes bacterium]|nr:methyltransferase domain-containing protein [Armatimonadota bacterium]
MPKPEEAARIIFGRRASQYAASACHSDSDVLARVVELASPEPHWTVLDVATGTGHTAFALAPHVASVTGVDLTPEMIREGEKLRLERPLANVEFRLGDVHDLPFPDQSFDLITCRRGAHHFSDMGRALAEMRRVLRPGGRLVIDDRSIPEDDFTDRCMNELDRYHDESHVRQCRPEEWRNMLETAGFSVERIEPYVIHRPLSSLTEGVSRENVEKIRQILDRLDKSQRESLNLIEINGVPHLNHWYVMISARNP